MRLVSMPLPCVILGMGVLQEVAASFHATMQPEAYLAHNEQLWHAMHDMLAPQAPSPLQRLPYPFRASMLALLSAELPHLVTPAAADGVSGALTSEGVGTAASIAIAEGAGSSGAAPNGAGTQLARSGRPSAERLVVGAEALVVLVLREARAAASSEDMDADTPLMESGLDSLAMVELVSRLREASGLQAAFIS